MITRTHKTKRKPVDIKLKENCIENLNGIGMQGLQSIIEILKKL